MSELIKIVEESVRPQFCEYPDGSAGWENLKRAFVVTGCASEESAIQANRIPRLDSKHEFEGTITGRCVKVFCELMNGDRLRYRIVAIYETYSDLDATMTGRIVRLTKRSDSRQVAKSALVGILIAVVIWVFLNSH